MTRSTAKAPPEARARSAPRLAGTLALAASPTFALMARVAAEDPVTHGICSAAPGGLPLGGMSAMYLLMCLFHLSPWLKLAFQRQGMEPATHPRPTTEGDRS